MILASAQLSWSSMVVAISATEVQYRPNGTRVKIGRFGKPVRLKALNRKFAAEAPASVADTVESVVGVRRDKAALSSGCEPHPATAPAGSNRSSHGGNEVAEAFD